MSEQTIVDLMKSGSARQRLEAAARLVELALRQLDTKSVPCATCSARLFKRYDQARVYESLSDLPTKLRRAALRTEREDSTHGYDESRQQSERRTRVQKETR